IGVPWRVAFALQAAGWWLRADIIWAKRAPMPESVTDRPTRSHEDIFLLTKRERYYYDAEAVKEPSVDPEESARRYSMPFFVGDKHESGGYSANGAKHTAGMKEFSGTRNQRDVWTLSPEPYPAAHFATFPTEIPRRAILAGTSERGCCPACGAPWERVVERRTSTNGQEPHWTNASGRHAGGGKRGGGFEDMEATTTGWRPTCTCGAPNAWRADDLEVISSPTGERVADDPTMQTGRNGYNRPRGDNEGQRPITRYEQRLYAAQLRNSPMRSVMETEADSAFEHYIRTDRNGARPVPDALLDKWLACGWLESVTVPEWEPLPPIPCTVLDPFLGSGTTVAVAVAVGRHAIGIELNQDYISLAEKRIRETQRPLL
ncbi:MAG: DNA methyltransferase, partial [Anaerolineae bacterium]